MTKHLESFPNEDTDRVWSLFSGISYAKAPGHKALVGMVSIALEAAGTFRNNKNHMHCCNDIHVYVYFQEQQQTYALLQ